MVSGVGRVIAMQHGAETSAPESAACATCRIGRQPQALCRTPALRSPHAAGETPEAAAVRELLEEMWEPSNADCDQQAVEVRRATDPELVAGAPSVFDGPWRGDPASEYPLEFVAALGRLCTLPAGEKVHRRKCGSRREKGACTGSGRPGAMACAFTWCWLLGYAFPAGRWPLLPAHFPHAARPPA